MAATYFTFGRDYCRTRNGVARRFLNDLVRQLVPEPMVEVSGSSDVDVSVARNHGKLLVNLVNTAGPHQQEPIIETIPPAGPLAVAIRQAVRPARVTLQPSGKPLAFDYGDGKLQLTVPEVLIHEVLVIETE